MSHEETRELFRTLSLKMQGRRSAQLSEVWVEKYGMKKVISECKEVENHLLQRIKQQLRQASK